MPDYICRWKTHENIPWSSSGEPSFVHVYCMLLGFPLAIRLIIKDSSSIPTTVADGGGVNFGGTILLLYVITHYNK